MMKKLHFSFLSVMLFTCLAINSCKKSDQTSLTDFLTQRPWKLALKQRLAYINSALVKTDTLESACQLSQTLTFNSNKNYTYQNYSCSKSTISAPWSITSDYLYLNLNSIISINSTKAKNVARIINLGQYSLVFDTGDINTVHKITDSVIVFRYGFIH